MKYRTHFFYNKIEMVLINEIFIVKEIDMIPTKINNTLVKIKNKVFSKVSRIYAASSPQKNEMTIDINTEIYRIHEEDKLDLLVLKVNPLLDQKKQENQDWIDFFGKDLLDLYEYVMYGTIFHSGIDEKRFFIYASFGGLLLKLFGNLETTTMEEIKVDSKILLMIRKV